MTKDLDFNQMDLDIMDAVAGYCKKNNTIIVDGNMILTDMLYTEDEITAYINHIHQTKKTTSSVDESINSIGMHIESIRDIITLETMIMGALGTTYMITKNNNLLGTYTKDTDIVDGKKYVVYGFFNDNIVNKQNLQKADESAKISKLECKFTYDKSTGLIAVGLTFIKDKERSILKIGINDIVIFRVPVSTNQFESSVLLSLEVIKQLPN